MTPAKQLRVFAKGNVDVRDSLLWSRVGGVLQWNGLNQALKERGHHTVARVKHETAVGFDFIPLPEEKPAGEPLAPIAPEALALLPADPFHPIETQATSAIFSAPADLVVLSLQPDVMNQRLVHKATGRRLLSPDRARIDPASRAAFLREFESGGMSTPEEAMARLGRLLDAIEEKLAAPVLVYNICPLLPGEQIESYLGAPDALALRIRKFNLALAELSTQRDFAIVDLERISARAGADRVKVDAVHFTAEGWRLIAHEVARILEARGLLAVEGARGAAKGADGL